MIPQKLPLLPVGDVPSPTFSDAPKADAPKVKVAKSKSEGVYDAADLHAPNKLAGAVLGIAVGGVITVATTALATGIGAMALGMGGVLLGAAVLGVANALGSATLASAATAIVLNGGWAGAALGFAIGGTYGGSQTAAITVDVLRDSQTSFQDDATKTLLPAIQAKVASLPLRLQNRIGEITIGKDANGSAALYIAPRGSGHVDVAELYDTVANELTADQRRLLKDIPLYYTATPAMPRGTNIGDRMISFAELTSKFVNRIL